MAETLTEVAALDRRHAETFVCRGIAHYLRKDYALALAELVQAESAGPENEHIYFWQGMVLLSQAKNDEAEMAFRHAARLGLPQGLWRPMLRFQALAVPACANYAQS